MPPALFSEMPFAKRARFPGDPYPTFPHSPWWHWMHSDACRADPAGSIHGICRDKAIAAALLEALPTEVAVVVADASLPVCVGQVELFAEHAV